MSQHSCLTTLVRLFAFFLILVPFRPVMAGDNWITLDRVTSANLHGLHFLNSQLGWVVGDSGIILKTTNSGQSWTFQDASTTRSVVGVFFADSATGWALVPVPPEIPPYDYGTFVMKTTNGGELWTREWHPERLYFALYFFNPLRGWMAGDFGKIVGTTDGGLTWFPANIDSVSGGFLAVRRIRFFSDSFGFGMGGRVEIQGVVWRTTNGGNRWIPQHMAPDPILDIHFFDSLNIIGMSGGFDDGTGMARTTDGGVSWEHEFQGLWGEPRALAFRTAAEAWSPLGFAGTIMKSLDSGRTWQDFFTPDTTAMYDITFTDSLTGFIVGEKGTILKYRPDPVSVGENDLSSLPGPITLYQNYPNPFNPLTNISFEVPGVDWVTLRIYDVLGRTVATLVNELMKPGMHTVSWNGTSDAGQRVASGVYLSRLQVTYPRGGGSLVQTRKVVLVR